MAIGFETTAPSTAMTVLRAAAEGLDNFSRLLQPRHHHPGAAGDPGVAGHADRRLHRPRPRLHRDRLRARTASSPRSTAGPSWWPVSSPSTSSSPSRCCCCQLREGRSEVENQYTRVVPWEGNQRALQAIDEVMEPRPTFEWRGLGWIPNSAMQVREKFARFDAERHLQPPRRTGSPTPRRASAARCCAAPSNRGSAGSSGPHAPPRRRSAPAWSRRRARAPPTTTSDASAGRGSGRRPRRDRADRAGRPGADRARSGAVRPG